ncbi:MAG: nuclease-related domain-containing protein [Anaerobacillus sp.]|uniref:nuclease-related domain-containing protein n=1 Tax=Anaerobacillus sp. TaxID=1872506 RepID=UPI003919BEA1
MSYDYKNSTESDELKIYRQLYLRKILLEKEKAYFTNLEKGYLGELAFDGMFDQQESDWLILNDILLEINNSMFQLDKVVITPDITYLFEVKNYEGDYYIEENNWYSLAKTEIKNPILQLQRSQSSLRRLLKQIGYDFSVEAYLIFINPEFHLYNAPLSFPIIYPTQLNRFLNQLKAKKHYIKDKQNKFAEKLLSLHVIDNPYNRLPKYQYENLKKGIICNFCGSYITETTERFYFVCNKCRKKERIENALLRSIDEFRLLFPNEKLTTNKLYDWCKIISSKKMIRRVLLQNFEHVGWGKSSYYVKEQ